jgi:hypothetical protein
MSARDDFGSSAGRGPGAGGLGNGGIGGGMGGGSRGGGAGYNGGAGSRTGLTTGTTTYGNTAFGRPGGNAVAYGMRDAASLNRAGMGPTVGSFGNFRTPSGAAMFGNSPVQGQSFRGMNMGQAMSQANRAQARQPQAQVDGLLGGAPVAAAAPAYPAVEQEMALPTNPPSFVNNPFVDKPATIADYVRSVVKSYQGLNAPAAAVTTPASALPNASWLRTNSMLNAPNVTGEAYDERFSPKGYVGPSNRLDTGMRGGGGQFGLAGGSGSR